MGNYLVDLVPAFRIMFYYPVRITKSKKNIILKLEETKGPPS